MTWIDTETAAVALGCSVRTVRRRIHDGTIPATRIQGTLYVDLDTVLDLADRQYRLRDRKTPVC